jgi:uncharacterized protein (DUF1800 family)
VNTFAVASKTGPSWRIARRALSLITCCALAACGGGGGSGGGSGGGIEASTQGTVSTTTPPSKEEASSFLAQATMGATDADIAQLSQSNYGTWLSAQFAKPAQSHRAYVVNRGADRVASGGSPSQNDFFESFWRQAIAGDDQLRQRAAFALSQVMVISFADANLSAQYRGVASYYDLLAEHAFGNYRDLLEGVTRHPMMGTYLSHRSSQKEDPTTGRVPDENYAREVMQLFSLGLYQLNLDGSPKTDGGGRPIETYNHGDIMGLARVFTGWSYYAGTLPAQRTDRRFFGNDKVDGWDWLPMQPYNKFHSTGEKKFLGVTIPAQSTPDAEADLKVALDTIFNHPNVGPFLAKNLIQRLVTSNPSPAYIARVASAFNNNGSGVRGDLKAVFQAILLDSEARAAPAGNPLAGKLREPVLRYSHFLRAFKAQSTAGPQNLTGINSTDNPSDSLGQSPMRAPSVFNFFRVGYVPPNTTLAAASKTAPEMQLVHEVTVAGYANFMRGKIPVNANADIKPDYSTELALADNPAALVDRLKLLLFAGQMPDGLRTRLITAVTSRALPNPVRNTAGAVTNQTAIDTAKLDRVYIAVFLSMTSPDYLVQK